MEKSNELTQTHREKTYHNNNDKKGKDIEVLKKEWKGTEVVYIYIYMDMVENWQETEQQKEYKQGQDEAHKLTERESRKQ